MRNTVSALTLIIAFAAAACSDDGGGNGDDVDASPDVDSGNVDVVFSPVPLPDPGIPGYSFPEPEATVVDWAATGDTAAINLHAWGLWTALTEETGEMFDGQPLRVFETWLTPGDIKNDQPPQHPRPLETVNQHQNSDPGATVLGFVKYDPTAADFAEQNNLFSAEMLNMLLAAGDTAIPNFPDTAVTLKPVFQPADSLVDDRYYRLPVWPGPPDPVQSWGSTEWPNCIWIDTQDTADGPGTAVDENCAGRTDETTYGLGRFIHFIENGTVNILVAMHVGTREMTRWTWQTFWWTPTPDNPYFPSSAAIAAERPAELQGAPRNYAHCTAYSMVDPPQPNTGGSNVGESVYCYNPWLEAGFTPENLPASQPGMYNGMPVANDFGVQTNCMSCHAQARWPVTPDGNNQNPFYTGDQYIDIDGSQFDGSLKLDFAWSIQGNAD